MKKSIFFLSTVLALLIGVVACNKDNNASNEMQPLIESELVGDNYEYDEESLIPFELEDRAASLASVSLKTSNAVLSSDACHNVKHEGMNIVPRGSATQWTLVGTELGTGSVTSKSNVTLEKYVKAIVYQSTPAFNKAKTDTVTCTNITWTDTGIDATLPAINFDSLRTFSVKFIVGVPIRSKDSTTVSYKVKSKTAKCIGSFLGARYGNFQWAVNTQAKYGNSLKLPTGMTVVTGNSSLSAAPTYGTAANLVKDSTGLTVLQVGDILERADGSKGIVYGLTTRDPKKGYKVRVNQVVCASGNVKSGTWVFNFPDGFKPKSDESGGSFTKFARKQ